MNGIAVYDLTNDASPQFVGRTDAGDRNFARIAVSTTRLFAAELPDTISIYNISAGGPILTARFREPVQTTAAEGARLFVSGTTFDQFGLATETGAPIRIFEGTTAVAAFRDLGGPVSVWPLTARWPWWLTRHFFGSSTCRPRALRASSRRCESTASAIA